jgi:3-methylfumaryl-CoA hydratase
MAQDIQDWIGRSTEVADVLRVQPARFMQATLDRAPDLGEGDAVPPLWHWLYCLEALRGSDLGRDAHPKKGGFLPPVALPRRMWAGGRVRFHGDLVLGADVRKVSTIKSIAQKSGRTGDLCFVTVAHDVFFGDDLVIAEEQDIVFREDPKPAADGAPAALAQAPDGAEWSERIEPTEVMLFRYSALTFNGHRIHYDVDYARAVEGYAGLVFHGPLTATLLADLALRKTCDTGAQRLAHFSYRGFAPLENLRAFNIEGRRSGTGSDLWARREDGAMAMSARAEWA